MSPLLDSSHPKFGQAAAAPRPVFPCKVLSFTTGSQQIWMFSQDREHSTQAYVFACSAQYAWVQSAVNVEFSHR